MGIWYQSVLSEFSHQIMMHCDAVESAVYAGNMREAQEAFSVLEKYWETRGTVMAYFIDHAHLNAVTNAFGELNAAMGVQSETEVLLANSRIKHEVQSLARDELFLPENIF